MVSVEERVAAFESRQHGLVTVGQLRELGLSEDAIRHRATSHRHVRARRGVLANPGVAPTYEQSVLAAVLAAGETAFASHDTAAWLWGLLRQAETPPIEVTTVLKRRPRVEGVTMHRSGLLIDPDVTRLRGIPVSTPERMVNDLSSRYSVHDLGVIIDDAVRRRLTSLGRISGLIDRLPRAPGRSPLKLREALARRVPDCDRRESELEDFVFDAIRKFELPLPVPQHRVTVNGRRRRIDLCYVDQRLAVEPKGFGWHATRGRFDDDALRGNELQLAGFDVLEFTTAFTDWQIADQVARGLHLPVPACPSDPLTFAEWLHRR